MGNKELDKICNTPLEDFLWEQDVKALRNVGIVSYEEIENMSVDDLKKLKGVGAAKAARIAEHTNELRNKILQSKELRHVEDFQSMSMVGLIIEPDHLIDVNQLVAIEKQGDFHIKFLLAYGHIVLERFRDTYERDYEFGRYRELWKGMKLR